MSDDYLAPPKVFGERSFAELNSDLITQYVEYRIHGQHPHVAFRRVFGEDYMDSVSHVRIELLEHNPYFKEHFARRLSEVKIDDLWNTRIAINGLMAMSRNPYAKDSTRLNAMRELNILTNIVVVDENGKTKAGRSLDDFYEKVAENAKTVPTVA
jgi:hypothetical protein